MQGLSSTFTGTVTVSGAPTTATGVVRLVDLQAAVANMARTGDTITTAQVVDLPALFGGMVAGVAADTGGFYVLSSGIQWAGCVRLLPGGRLVQGSGGLAVNSSGLALVGHTHHAADIVDLGAAIGAGLPGWVISTPTVQWSFGGGGGSGIVVCAPGGGVLATGGGLAVDLGTGHTQAAYGDHTHGQLHNPFTIEASNSLAWSLAGQDLSGEVRCAAGGALKVVASSGLAVDLGTGHTQAAYGDHTHALLHPPVAVTNSSTVALGIDAGQNLTAGVVYDLAPPGGYAPLAVTAGGLSLPLGSGINQPASGQHQHAVAVAGVSAGFMSAQQAATLAALSSGIPLITGVGATPSLTLAVSAGHVLTGVVVAKPVGTLAAAEGLVLANDPAGLKIQLASGILNPATQGNFAAAGNHTHPVPTGTGLRHLTAGVEDGAAYQITNTDVATGAGIVEAKLALNYPTCDGTLLPTAGQKLALAGSANAPGAANPYVTLTDARLTREVWRFTLRNASGVPLVGGENDFFIAPYSGIVTGWDVIGDVPGVTQVDVLRSSLPTWPPTGSMAGSELPLLPGGGAQYGQNLAVSTWAGGGLVAPNDALLVKVTAVDGVVRRVNLQLRVTRV